MIIYSDSDEILSLTRYLGPALLLAGVLTLFAVAPLGAAASPAYTTNAISQSGMKLVTINSYQGVMVNYTSTYSGSFNAFVYLALISHSGQVAYWNVASCSFTGSELVQCFVSISPSVPSGAYTAHVFATTAMHVPVSSTSSLPVTL